MAIEFKYVEKEAYLLAKVPDVTIDLQRAESIFESIDTECRKMNCQRVLIDELALERRRIASHELRRVCEKMPDIRLAFLCKPELIDVKAKLLSAFTFTEEYVARHFSEETEAIKWLTTARRR